METQIVRDTTLLLCNGESQKVISNGSGEEEEGSPRKAMRLRYEREELTELKNSKFTKKPPRFHTPDLNCIKGINNNNVNSHATLRSPVPSDRYGGLAQSYLPPWRKEEGGGGDPRRFPQHPGNPRGRINSGDGPDHRDHRDRDHHRDHYRDRDYPRDRDRRPDWWEGDGGGGGGGRGGRARNNDRNHYGRRTPTSPSRKGSHQHHEKEPEWFSSGPTSRHETMELRGFNEDDREGHRGRRTPPPPQGLNSDRHRTNNSNRQQKILNDRAEGGAEREKGGSRPETPSSTSGANADTKSTELGAGDMSSTLERILKLDSLSRVDNGGQTAGRSKFMHLFERNQSSSSTTGTDETATATKEKSVASEGTKKQQEDMKRGPPRNNASDQPQTGEDIKLFQQQAKTALAQIMEQSNQLRPTEAAENNKPSTAATEEEGKLLLEKFVNACLSSQLLGPQPHPSSNGQSQSRQGRNQMSETNEPGPSTSNTERPSVSYANALTKSGEPSGDPAFSSNADMSQKDQDSSAVPKPSAPPAEDVAVSCGLPFQIPMSIPMSFAPHHFIMPIGNGAVAGPNRNMNHSGPTGENKSVTQNMTDALRNMLNIPMAAVGQGQPSNPLETLLRPAMPLEQMMPNVQRQTPLGEFGRPAMPIPNGGIRHVFPPAHYAPPMPPPGVPHPPTHHPPPTLLLPPCPPGVTRMILTVDESMRLLPPEIQLLVQHVNVGEELWNVPDHHRLLNDIVSGVFTFENLLAELGHPQCPRKAMFASVMQLLLTGCLRVPSFALLGPPFQPARGPPPPPPGLQPRMH